MSNIVSIISLTFLKHFECIKSPLSAIMFNRIYCKLGNSRTVQEPSKTSSLICMICTVLQFGLHYINFGLSFILNVLGWVQIRVHSSLTQLKLHSFSP